MPPLDVSLRQLEYIVAVADSEGFPPRRGGLRRRAAVAQHAGGARGAAARRPDLRARSRERPPLGRRHGHRRTGASRSRSRRANCATWRASLPIRFAARCGSASFRPSGRTCCPRSRPRSRARFPICSCCGPRLAPATSCTQLKEGGLDGVLLALEADVSDLDHEVIARDPFVLAASAKHPLVKEREAHARRCPERASGPAPRRWTLFSGAGAELLHAGESRRAQLPRDQPGDAGSDGECRHGGDAPAVAVPAGRESPRAVARAPVLGPEPGRTIALAWRRGSAMREPLVKIAETVRESVEIGRAGTRSPR